MAIATINPTCKYNKIITWYVAAVLDKAAKSWTPPPLGSWKINTDAVVNSAKGLLGIDIIIRDHLGLVAEGSALLREVYFAADSGLVPASLESDAAAVVAAVNAALDVGSEFGLILHEIRVALFGSSISPICFAPKVCN
ncbi:hypothetical protein ACOSP7_007347 [Xanthoceras sorbifolium]